MPIRTFDNFPDHATCPLCGTNENKKCFLIPIDGTEDGNISEAQPTHLDCLLEGTYRINKEHGIIYRYY